MEKWIERIRNAKTYSEMDALIEEMSMDENITNVEYTELYMIAVSRFDNGILRNEI